MGDTGDVGEPSAIAYFKVRGPDGLVRLKRVFENPDVSLSHETIPAQRGLSVFSTQAPLIDTISFGLAVMRESCIRVSNRAASDLRRAVWKQQR